MRLQTTFVALGTVSTLTGAAITVAVLGITHTWTLPQRILIVLLGVLLTTAVIAAASYRLAQAFRRRLYEIEEAAVLMAGGRLHHRVTRFGEHDEIDQVAAEFNRMGEQLEAQVDMLQQLAAENQHLTDQAKRMATIEERQRVARELHDSVSQDLFALTLLSATAIRRLESGLPKLPENLAQIADLATRAQREMRALLLHLRPVELEGRSFQEAADSFLRGIAERHSLVCQFTYGIAESLPAAIEEQWFRILQEAVANVLKHANATELWVTVDKRLTAYELTVSDNGVGMANVPQEATDTYGLQAMRERAARLGGRLEVLSRNPGTTLQVVIPRADRGENE